MNKNLKLYLGLIFFCLGTIASALFAIANSLSYLAYTTGNPIVGPKNQTLAGILCFVFLVVAISGFVMILTDIFSKNKKSN